MKEKQQIKDFLRQVLGIWEINFGDYILLKLFQQIDKLPDDKINKSITLIKEFF